MSTLATGLSAANYKPLSHKQSLVLVFIFTLMGATAQMLMKTGMQRPAPTLWTYVTNVPLLIGYTLYGLGAVLFTLALRDGELSILYPVISLSYVWVTLLSIPVLHETINSYKVVGISTIMAGVAVLGRSQTEKAMTGTPVSSILLILVASVIGSMGAVFLKMGAEPLRHGIRHALNPKLAAGVGLFLGSSVFYLLGLRHGEVSVLFPMVSVSYVLGAIWSRIFFGEPFTKAKFMGLALILTGVVFVGLGKH